MSPFCRSPLPLSGWRLLWMAPKAKLQFFLLMDYQFFSFDLCRNKNSFFQYPKGRKKVTIYFFAVIFPMRIDLFLPIQFLGLLMIIHIKHLIFVKTMVFLIWFFRFIDIQSLWEKITRWPINLFITFKLIFACIVLILILKLVKCCRCCLQSST